MKKTTQKEALRLFLQRGRKSTSSGSVRTCILDVFRREAHRKIVKLKTRPVPEDEEV